MIARYDVLVLGGGPAGLATAIHIRRKSPASVLVVEAGEGPRERVGETVPPDILVLLNQLGLAERFRQSGHLPCPGSVSLWGRTQPGFNDFILNPLGPAWHLNRQRFDQMLADRAVAVGAILATETHFVTAEFNGNGYQALLSHSSGDYRAEARWIIDATGANARFARQQGATQNVHDRMVTMACFSNLRGGSFSSQTILEATPQGWWYAARLPEDRILTMLVTESEEVKRLAADGYRLWKEELRSTSLLGPRVAACERDGDRFLCLPVLSCILDPLEGERWLAVGDAASCYDPVASQGIYKALVDASDAASHVVAALGFAEAPPWRYGSRVQNRFQDYLANRAYLYNLEQRWPDAMFWSRRARASERSPVGLRNTHSAASS
jgi:flavin-dependent dehydrogenase